MSATNKKLRLIPGVEPMEEGRRIARAGILLIVLAFGGFGVWAVTAPLSGAVIVPGIVKVDSYRKTVQHLEGGIVREILVKVGDRVNEEQPLIVLDNVQASAEVGVLQGQLDGELVRNARLSAEVARLPSFTFPKELSARAAEPHSNLGTLIQSEQRVFAARKRLVDGQADLIRSQIKEMQAEIAGLGQQLHSADEQIGYIKEQLDMNESLRTQNFVSYARVLDFKRDMASKQEDRGQYVAQIAQARQKISESGLRIVTLYDNYAKDAAEDLKETRKKIADLEDRIRPSQDQLQRSVVTAPIAGVVVDLKVHSVGGVVAPREPLMDIVPDNATLMIEGKMRPDDIKHVGVGADVDVQLTAYKRRITPRVKGKLTYISADVLSENTDKGASSYYQIYVVIKKEDLKTGGDLELTPGMPVEAFIRTSSRTVLEYIFQPITDSMRRAFREY